MSRCPWGARHPEGTPEMGLGGPRVLLPGRGPQTWRPPARCPRARARVEAVRAPPRAARAGGRSWPFDQCHRPCPCSRKAGPGGSCGCCVGLGVHAGAGQGQVLVPSVQGPRETISLHSGTFSRKPGSARPSMGPLHPHTCTMPTCLHTHVNMQQILQHTCTSHTRTHVRHPITRVLTHVQLCTRQLRACFLKCLVTPWRWAASL